MTMLVAYYRVSTQRQGRSGLGLDAQRKAVTAYAASEGFEIAEEFTEIATGKGSDALEKRPVFAAAVRKAKKLKATIIVAKLDRLSRDVAFIANLMTKKVMFRSADAPNDPPLVLHIRAAVAEDERRTISQRTRDALAAAKERGVKLGNQKIADENKAAAAARDAQLKPILQDMIGSSTRAIAKELTSRGIETPNGGKVWNPMTVMRAMKRLGFAD